MVYFVLVGFQYSSGDTQRTLAAEPFLASESFLDAELFLDAESFLAAD